MSIALAATPPAPVETDACSPLVRVQAGLDELVDIAARSRKIEAMQQSVRVGVLHEAVQFALRNAEAFTSPRLSPARRREIARRAVTAELATALRLPEQTMSRLIDEASSLCTQLPATYAALRAGAIDYAHARVVVDATNDLDDDDVTRGRLDTELAARAVVSTAATLRRAARRLREEVQAETIVERHARARSERRVEFEPATDGMAWLHLFLEASDAMLICDRLDRVASEVAVDASTPESRTRDQLRADVARDLLLEGVPPVGDAFHVAAATVRPSVHVTVPVLTLLGTSDEPGELDGYGPISPETARRLAAHAPSFTRLLTHPVDGAVLDLDRTVYRPPADLTKWLRVRDETCRFPGCNRRASRCDVDHTDDFAEGGRTAFDNLAHLCSHHHHVKHESSWSVAHHSGGVLEWRSPSGRTHTTRPAGPIRRPAEPGSAPTAESAPTPGSALTPGSAPTPRTAPTPRAVPAPRAAPRPRATPRPRPVAGVSTRPIDSTVTARPPEYADRFNGDPPF